MTHAGTIEREVIDLLLTDPNIRALVHRDLLEEIIERTLEIAEIESLKQELSELEDQNTELSDEVSQLKYKLDSIREILE